MKKIFNLALVAALAIGVVSCSKDSVDDGLGYDAENNSDKLTFVLPANTGGITYATVADADEMVLDLTKTSIYMFGASDELEAVITDIQVGSSAGKTTATIAKNKAWEGKKNFIFVGNNTRASQLPKTVPTSPAMALSDFQEILTDAHSAAAPLATPLMLTSALKEVTDIKTAPAVIAGDVSLYRNVARFDIDNNVSVGNVEIKKVYVNDAKLDGYVFGYQNATIGGTTIGDLEFAVAAPVSTLVVDNSGVDDVYNDLQQEEHLFYIYPTEVKADNSATTLQLVGSVNGVDKIFSLRKYDVDGVTPVDLTIEPNKRYIISAIDALTQTFTLVVADWEEGESIVGKPDATGGTFGMAGLSAGSVGTFNGFATIKVPTAGGVVKFAMKASSKAGTSFVVSNGGSGAMVDVSTAIEGNVTETPGAVVYARPYYESNYEVVVPAFNANETSVTKITVTDKADDTKTMDVYIYHEAEDGSLIPISEVTFPDADFRNYIETKQGIIGEATQAQFDAVEEIANIPAATRSRISSLKGIEYFRNLLKLNLESCVATELDVTSLLKLQDLNIKATSMLAIDLSKNVDLIKIAAGQSKLVELDFSNNQKMEYITAFACPSLERVVLNSELRNTLKILRIYDNPKFLFDADLSGFTKLEDLILSRLSNITSLNVSGCGSLTEIHANLNPKLTSIDVTNCPALTYLTLTGSPVQSLSVSDSPLLIYLGVAGTAITDLDISTNTKLQTFHYSNTPITPDVTHLPDLEVLSVGKDVENIDLSQNAKLRSLKFGAANYYEDMFLDVNSKIKSLDLSNNTDLKELYLINCPNLSSVKVWDAFTTPEAVFETVYMIYGTTPENISYVKE